MIWMEDDPEDGRDIEFGCKEDGGKKCFIVSIKLIIMGQIENDQ